MFDSFIIRSALTWSMCFARIGQFAVRSLALIDGFVMKDPENEATKLAKRATCHRISTTLMAFGSDNDLITVIACTLMKSITSNSRAGRSQLRYVGAPFAVRKVMDFPSKDTTIRALKD